MKKSRHPRGRSAAKSATGDLRPLLAEVRQLIHSARHAATRTINTLQVLTNFEIGRRIVEHEQQGEKRAEYGAELMKELSVRLTEEFGRGFSRANLEYMRRFYLEWQNRVPRIAQQASGELDVAEIQRQPAVRLATSAKPSRPSPFTLSWSHYVELLTIKDPNERSFYEIEATNSGWSVPELRRQIPQGTPSSCDPPVS